MAEIVAVLLYTHKKLDIYVDMKTTMTCKDSKKEVKSDIGYQNNYTKWKDNYEIREGK